MVLRKSTSQDDLVPAPLSQAAHHPPYPVSPSSEQPPVLPPEFTPDPSRSPAFALKTPDEVGALQNPEKEDSEYSLSDWENTDGEDSEPEPQDLPAPLKVGGGKPLPQKKDSLPDVLKVKAPPAIQHKKSYEMPAMQPKKSYEMITPNQTGASTGSWGGLSNDSGGSVPLQTNNPYLRMQNTGQSNFGVENSQQAWADAPGHPPPSAPVELPASHTPDTPTDRMAHLTLNSGIPPRSSPKVEQPPIISIESPTPHQTPATATATSPDASRRWDAAMQSSSIDAWAQKHVEHPKPARDSPQVPHVRPADQTTGLIRSSPPLDEEQPPALPPRRSQEQGSATAMPQQSIDTMAGTALREEVESPNTIMNKRRKEHYPIKHIRWLDSTVNQIRESPILTQNVNGPCPLLALVNALVLSTPIDLRTDFVETLRTREQVSLGLLVDAVIEELMSGRRGNELGDINELYKFLIGLQTGMNVNPMFVHDAQAGDGSSVHNLPGGFENTRDMRLYRTFNMPLIHGWLPEPNSEEYAAFGRVAKTYETAQYVQFQEEELEAKLQTEGLDAEEQRLFTDIQAIKEFLSRWPTQLTEYGLRNMQQAIKPGEVGILFRNDHFSTLYKNPHTNELMTLVTDQGYASHDEIVWESLVDLSGRGSELYSGDFRAIGNNSLPQSQQQQQHDQSFMDANDGEWTTVQGSRRRNDNPTSSAAEPTPDVEAGLDPSRTEQEDHDLALALQLQEEEEDRHRRSQEERRRRDAEMNQLSENAISSQTGRDRTPRQSEYPPLIPPRRSNLQNSSRSDGEGNPPPPTYEEAATTPQYHPPAGHPANPTAPLNPRPGPQGNSSNINLGQGGRRPQGRPLGSIPQTLPPRPGRRQSGVVGPNGQQEEREKCVVM
ncbi:hypothetical protein M011DRAFT_408667 [Sporormia fimetaria CBS 119925]|uniref:MINDY deubiquitinase domain-containing protein n=1 Tax=Sporormia fimetaria CBS 119925 TaxID=1340428 RepID=A0A6A6V1V5_9PLEO|nr:hypothetical protein M011DRAFT_408667 [Sporormia fimetaria CBS 119925]